MNEKNTSFSHSVNVRFGNSRNGLGFGFWLGIVLVIIGGGSLLDAFGMIEFGELLHTWWPSLLMFIAVVQLATRSGSLFGSGILFTIGAIFQLSHLGYLNGGFWGAFWPIILILIGLSFISSRWKKKGAQYSADASETDLNSLGRVSLDGSRVDRSALFTGIDCRVTSQDFTGGQLEAIFGGIECDMRDAKIMGKVASLTVTAICGGVDIRVPQGWNIVVKGTPIFGGIDDKSVMHPHDPNAPMLVIDVTAVFGGVEIRH